MTALIPLAVMLPLAGGFLAALVPGRLRRLADVLAIIVTGGVLVLSFNLLYLRADYRVGGWDPRVGILLVLDGFSAFMLVVVAAISF
ncbi:MAG TPA: Na+/H+ antiporter subunit D, partial [Planctomycetes bacterium]|nr:Na+/H+ antiporter subunit D [Planctomycetota bacterium]